MCLHSPQEESKRLELLLVASDTLYVHDRVQILFGENDDLQLAEIYLYTIRQRDESCHGTVVLAIQGRKLKLTTSGGGEVTCVAATSAHIHIM